MKIEPYWWGASPPRQVPEQAVRPSCDVAVVGAGYAGLHAALALARAGRSVQIFDREDPGFGASSRNGGVVSGNTHMHLRDLIGTLGLESALGLFREGMAAQAWLGRFIDDERIACDFAKPGRFIGAYRPSDYETLGREADAVNRHFDGGFHVVARAGQQAYIGTDAYHGGLVRDDVWAVHPARYHAGLLDRAVASGVAVHGRCAVDGFRREGDGFAVATARGPVKARALVIATNGYTDKTQPWLRRRLVIAASQIIATEPLPEDQLDRLMPAKRMLLDTRRLFPYYRPSPDHTRIIFGGRAGAWSSDPAVKVKALRRILLSIFPELEATAITHLWWGNIAFTFDRRPKLALEDGVHYATGFCGSGTVWASWFGHLAARRIIAEAPVVTALGADPFQSRPLYWGWPWFLPFLLGWYRLRDAL